MDRRIWTNFIEVAVISRALQLDVEFTKKSRHYCRFLFGFKLNTRILYEKYAVDYKNVNSVNRLFCSDFVLT